MITPALQKIIERQAAAMPLPNDEQVRKLNALLAPKGR